MPNLVDYAPAYALGVWVTVQVAVAGIVGAVLVSAVLGALRLSPRRWVRVAAAVLIEASRGASALVVLFWVFYALPLLPGMPRLPPLTASVLVLAVVGGAYGAEIVRAGVAAVDRGQFDACRALGLSRWRAARLVVVPQALTQIVPAFGSLAADIVKWTSIVSFVGVQDMLHVANSVRSITYETVPVFCILAVTYWLLCLGTSVLFRALESALPMTRALRASGVAPCGTARGGPLGGQLGEAPR